MPAALVVLEPVVLWGTQMSDEHLERSKLARLPTSHDTTPAFILTCVFVLQGELVEWRSGISWSSCLPLKVHGSFVGAVLHGDGSRLAC